MLQITRPSSVSRSAFFPSPPPPPPPPVPPILTSPDADGVNEKSLDVAAILCRRRRFPLSLSLCSGFCVCFYFSVHPVPLTLCTTTISASAEFSARERC